MPEPPFVSVVIPCFNEARFIDACLGSVVGSDYPSGRLEILVVDGMSNDGTRDILAGYTRRCPFVRVLDNPRRVTPVALNIGIAASRGDVVAWMSAHNRYAPNYLSESIRCLDAYGADNVGGVLITIPSTEGLTGLAIARALSHRFGVGNSYTKIHVKEPRWFDAVFGGCYRRTVFDRVGLFNERLVRGQDMEFHIRLRRAGGRILLAPSVVSYYYARGSLSAFWRQNWNNGVWAILPFLYSDVVPVSPRHLVPLGFVTGLIAGAVFAAILPAARWLAVGLAGCYLVASLAASANVAIRERDARYLAVMPVVFATLHMAYGLGSLWGIVLVGHTLLQRASVFRRSQPRGAD